jgi:ATP-dependent Clp protease protease subunit
MPDPDTNLGRRIFEPRNEDELLRRRIVLLEGMLDDKQANQVIARLLYLQFEDLRKPIHLHVNSVGGSVCAGLSIIDTMHFLTCPVYTYCGKQGQGIAAIIVASGVKGRRYAESHSILSILPLFIDQPLRMPAGQANLEKTELHTMMLEIIELNKRRHELADIISERAGQPKALVREDFLRGRTLDAYAAVKYGLVDAVVERENNQDKVVLLWPPSEDKGR